MSRVPWRLAALILGCFALLVAALLVAGASPKEALAELIRGSVGSPGAIGRTLRETTPLLMLGTGVYVALRAGLFNIGIEGQFLVGALAATYFGLRLPGPSGVLVGILAGIVAGGLWALPAGLIRAYRNGHEVITTIMLNNIALALTTGLVAGPLKDPGQQSPSTATMTDATRLPMLFSRPPVYVNVALIVGLLLVAAFAWWLRRTVAGYELRLVGDNPTAARAAGVSLKPALVRAMLVSGMIGGLAGASHVFAFEGRFYQGMSPGYGFDALGVALLAGGSPLGILPSALLFGGLSAGSTAVNILGVPKGITGVILAMLIVGFAAFRYRKVAAVG